MNFTAPAPRARSIAAAAGKFPSTAADKDYTFDTNLIIKEPLFIGVLLGFVYDYYHTIKDKDEHYALLL